MKIFLLFFYLILSTISFSQCKLRVTVKNIDYKKKGSIRVGLFDKKGFPNANQVIDGKVVKISGSEVTVEFYDLSYGQYAIAVVHDQNQDQKLTKNLVGYPTEPYAFSNNATGNFGPPDFKDAAILLDKTVKTITINL